MRLWGSYFISSQLLRAIAHWPPPANLCRNNGLASSRDMHMLDRDHLATARPNTLQRNHPRLIGCRETSYRASNAANLNVPFLESFAMRQPQLNVFDQDGQFHQGPMNDGHPMSQDFFQAVLSVD
jgi:hypothetical protein